MSWQQCQLWMFTCFLFLWRLCCELNQTIAPDTKITANAKCLFFKLAKFPDIVHSMVPQIIDLAQQRGSCTEGSRWAWGVQRNRYLLVSLPRALIHKTILSVGDRGLLQPSSERAVESVLPDVPVLEKVEHFGLLMQLSVHSWWSQTFYFSSNNPSKTVIKKGESIFWDILITKNNLVVNFCF